MKRLVVVMAALSLFLSLASVAVAQDAAKQKEEADAYKAWYDVATSKDKDPAKRYEFGKAFLAKFPSSKNAVYVKPDVAKARGELFNLARQAKKIDEEIRLGEEALAETPDNIDYLYLLAFDVRAVELFANPPNYSHETKARDYTERTIKLIEAGKVPAVVPKEQWNQNKVLAFFTQTLAVLEQKDKKTDKALELYKKCASLDPTTPTYYLQIGVLHYEKYGAASTKFNALPTEQRAEPEKFPEAKAALDEVNAQADVVIDNWARFLGLTMKDAAKWEPTRKQIEETAVNLYKFRNPNSQTGFQELVNKYSAPPTN